MGQSKIAVYDFLGLDQSKEDISLQCSKNAYNVETEGGVLRRAKGCRKYIQYELSSSIKTLACYHKNEGGCYQDFIIAATAGSVYVYKQGSWWMYGYGMQSGDYSYINYKKSGADIIILCNGKDYPLCYNGSASYYLMATPRFKNITLHYERMWGSGVEGEPDRVYYSKAFAPENFSDEDDSGFIEIPTFDGGKIISVQAVLNDVVVFKEQNMFRIYGTYPGAFEVGKIYGITGPIAAKSIVSAGDKVYFLAKEGLCVYDGLKAGPFGQEILKDVFSSMNKTYAENARACIHGGKLYMAVPVEGSDVNNAVIEYDEKRGVFLLKKGFNVESFLPYGDKLLFSGGGNYVLEYGAGETFDGNKIEAVWETPYIDLKRKDMRKTVKKFHAYASGGGIVITLDTDGNQRQRQIVLTEEISHIALRFQNKGLKFKFIFSNANGQDFTLMAPEAYIDTDGG